MLQNGPLIDYRDQHGYSTTPDRSEEIIRQEFPNVVVKRSKITEARQFGCELYNEILPFAQDFDIVFRLDPDMFFTDKDWGRLIEYVRTTDFDCYRMDFKTQSINYYVTNEYTWGLRDAKETDLLALDPRQQLMPVLSYPSKKDCTIPLEDWICHHFRGWNKTSVTASFPKEHQELADMCGGWVSCPLEIQEKLL